MPVHREDEPGTSAWSRRRTERQIPVFVLEPLDEVEPDRR
jgi:hypothetical protein